MEEAKDVVQTLLEGIEGKAIKLVDIPSEAEPDGTCFVDPILLDDESIDGLMNSEEFVKGMTIGAKYAGIYTAMINVGASVSFAEGIVFNAQMEDIAKTTGTINKEIAEVTSVNVMVASEKNQL